MNQSNFQFINPYLTDLVFNVNKENTSTFDGKEVTVSAYDMSVKINRVEDENEAIVELSVNISFYPESKPELMLYSLSASISSEFKWHDIRNEQSLQIFLSQNAPALLLAYLRPIVANITNNSPFPPCNIPFMNFTGNEEYLKEKKAELI